MPYTVGEVDIAIVVPDPIAQYDFRGRLACHLGFLDGRATDFIRHFFYTKSIGAPFHEITAAITIITIVDLT